MKRCKVDKCNNQHTAHGLCAKHNRIFIKNIRRDPNRQRQVEECQALIETKKIEMATLKDEVSELRLMIQKLTMVTKDELCLIHVISSGDRKTAPKCVMPECNNYVLSKNLCKRHLLERMAEETEYDPQSIDMDALCDIWDAMEEKVSK